MHYVYVYTFNFYVYLLSRATLSNSSGGQEQSYPEMTVIGILWLAPLVESGNEVNSMSRTRVMATLILDVAMQIDESA